VVAAHHTLSRINNDSCRLRRLSKIAHKRPLRIRVCSRNTPQPPLEASGTSGVKAAFNGIPSLSVLDGWWLEGLVHGVTGWAIGDRKGTEEVSRSLDAARFYEKLEGTILPMFYHDRERFIDIMRHAIAINGSHFNTQRMLQQYVSSAYLC
jgi:starch phosphorylase